MDAVRIAKETVRVVSQNINFALIMKFVVLILAAAGYITMWESVFTDVGVMIISVINAAGVCEILGINRRSMDMKRYTGKLTAVVLAAFMLTGCGSHLLEDGTELLREGSYEEAAAVFQEAADEDAKDPEAWRGLGLARWEQEDYEGALEAFQSVLDNDGKKTGRALQSDGQLRHAA